MLPGYGDLADPTATHRAIFGVKKWAVEVRNSIMVNCANDIALLRGGSLIRRARRA